MTDFLVAIALAIALEGMLYALFPQAMKKMLKSLLFMPTSSLRTAGLTAAMIGVALVWVFKSSGF